MLLCGAHTITPKKLTLPSSHLSWFTKLAGAPCGPEQALEAAALKPGQRVLIHAGAGGVGSVAVQLAKARGLHVATTCSTRNLAFVKQVGRRSKGGARPSRSMVYLA